MIKLRKLHLSRLFIKPVAQHCLLLVPELALVVLVWYSAIRFWDNTSIWVAVTVFAVFICLEVNTVVVKVIAARREKFKSAPEKTKTLIKKKGEKAGRRTRLR